MSMSIVADVNGSVTVIRKKCRRDEGVFLMLDEKMKMKVISMSFCDRSVDVMKVFLIGKAHASATSRAKAPTTHALLHQMEQGASLLQEDAGK